MKKRIFVVVISLVVLVLDSCTNSPVEAPIIPEVQPGRRDYVWTEDTLKIPKGENSELGSIWGSNPLNIWAVGGASLSQLGIWHYDGTAWNNGTITPTFNQHTLWGTSANDIWLGNLDGIMWHFNGSDWTYYTQLQVSRYKNFAIQSIWGVSSNEIYAVGTAYNSYFNEDPLGGIFKYNGKNWEQISLPKIFLNFFQLRKAKNNNFLISALKGSVDSTKLVVWNGKEFRVLFADVGFASFNVFNIGETTLFNIGKIIYKYNDDGTYELWKDFSGTDYYDKILCSRNEKDFFIGSWALQGINHYNGNDLKLVYFAPNTRVWTGVAFEKDVFFPLIDLSTSNTRIVHGRLRD